MRVLRAVLTLDGPSEFELPITASSVQYAAIPGTWSHLPPLVMMSVLFGAVFGWAKKLLA